MSQTIHSFSHTPQEHSEPSSERWLTLSQQWLSPLLRRASWIVITLALAVVVFRVVAHFTLGTLWDDAYIFQRYAHNLRQGHGWAWQPGGEPTYGTTSLAFVLPAVAFQALVDNPALAALLTSTLGGVLFLVVMVFTLRSLRASRAVTAIAGVGFAVCCAWSALPAHFITGMDTTWALAFLAGYLWLLQRFEHRPATSAAVALGAVGGLAFAVRPDLMAFTVVIPALWSVLTRDKQCRRQLWLALGLTVMLSAALLSFNAWYFKSALPLPFYAKSLRLYGGSLRRVYRGVSTENMLHFLAGCWPLLLLLLLDLLAGPRQWWRSTKPLDKAALAATLIFGSYYWIVALPVMSMSQRFLQPLFPVFVWAAARTAVRWEAAHHRSVRTDAGRWALSVAGGFGLLLMLVSLWPHVTKHGTAFVRRVAHGNLRFDMVAHSAQKGPRSYWYQLDKVSALPDDLVLATTEVGFIGALNPNKRIIDMAGLNERAFAHRPFDPERLLSEDRPDFIYMPHVDYKAMREALIESETFRRDYQYYTLKQLRTKAFGVAIRRDSKHYAAMRRLLPKGLRSAAKSQGMRRGASLMQQRRAVR